MVSRLQNKLIIAFLIISLIPITIVGAYSIYSKSEALSEAAVGRLTNEVSEKTKNIKFFLSDAENEVLALSQLSSLQGLLNAYAAQDEGGIEVWRKRVEQDFLTFSRNKEVYYQIRYLDAEGQEVARIDSDGRSSRIIPKEELQYKGDRYYFPATMELEKGEVFVSPVDLNREGSPPRIEVPYRPVIRYATPVYDSRGERRGIVITNIFAEHFLNPLKKTTTEGYGVFLVDSNGYYLVHPNSSKEWGSPRDLGTDENLRKDYPQLANQILNGSGSVIEDEKDLVAFSSISTGRDGNPLVVVERGPKEIIFASVASFKRFFLIFFTASIFLAIGLAVYLAKKTTKPIAELAEAAKKISTGDFKANVPVETKDEVGILAESFNAMTRELKSSYEGLEQAVEERTKELLLLQKINNMLNEGANLDKILQTIVDGLTSIFSYDISAVHLLDENKTSLTCKCYSAPSLIVEKMENLTGLTALNYRIPLYKGSMFSKLTETKKPILTTDIVALVKSHTDKSSMHTLAPAVAKLSRIKSGVGVPLLAGDKIVGVIGIGSRQRLSEKDTRRLANFAKQAGLAVERAQMYRTLEEKVEERTKELLQSEKLATIGQLAAGVAHEINTPLTSILMNAQMLLEDAKEDDATIKLVEIVEQAESAAEIVQNLLDFSRQSKPKVTYVDINTEILKVLEIVKISLGSIELVNDLEQNLPRVLGDPKQLQQVFMNIITNAIQAMPDGGKLIISTKENNGRVEIKIADTGAGIPKEMVHKIFDPFFTTKGVGVGTGLGLSIAMGIVESHHGTIEVKSEVGSGSIFTIKLPAGGTIE